MYFIIFTTVGVVIWEEGKSSEEYILICILTYFNSVSIYSYFDSFLSF